MRCLACNELMTDEDLKLDEEFCPDCFSSYLENLKDISED